MTTQDTNARPYQILNLVSEEVMEPLTRQMLAWLPPALKAPFRLQQWALHRAVERVYTTFSRRHPELAASLFDEHFLKHGAAALLTRFVQHPTHLDAGELATAWAKQLGPANSTVTELRRVELALAAADFLDWLDLEIRQSPLLRAGR